MRKYSPQYREQEKLNPSQCTIWVNGKTLEDKPVIGEEECTLCRQQDGASHVSSSGLLPTIRQQVHPQAFVHHLLSRHQ